MACVRGRPAAKTTPTYEPTSLLPQGPLSMVTTDGSDVICTAMWCPQHVIADHAALLAYVLPSANTDAPSCLFAYCACQRSFSLPESMCMRAHEKLQVPQHGVIVFSKRSCQCVTMQ